MVNFVSVTCTITKLFSFIYGQQVKLDTLATVVEFLHAARKYNCKEAVEKCKNFMKITVNLKSAIIFYETAVLYKCLDVKNECEKVLVEQTKDILESSEFLAAHPDTVKAIFEYKNASVESEMDFVRALEKYIEHHKKSDPEIVTKVRPALNFIRFLTLSPGDIANSTLLTPVEVRDLIVCQYGKDDLSKMPIGFSVTKEGRGTWQKPTRFETFDQMAQTAAFGESSTGKVNLNKKKPA